MLFLAITAAATPSAGWAAASCNDAAAAEPRGERQSAVRGATAAALSGDRLKLIEAGDGAVMDRAATTSQSAQLTAPAALASSAEGAQAERLMRRGDAFLAQGNIAVARQYFARAADTGLALAAFRLAETYDPGELARLNTRGVVADVSEARRWYQRAQSPLLPEATVRLGRLGNGWPCPGEQPAAIPGSRPETDAGDRASDRAPSAEER